MKLLAADPVARRGAVFAVSLLVALVGGFLVGKVSGSGGAPAGAPADPPHVHAGGGSYGMVVESPPFVAGVSQPLRFTVRAPDGAVVTRFETVHDKQLHLIVVRTDLTGYQHLHPVLGPDGVWSVALALPAMPSTTTDPAGAGGTAPLLAGTSTGPLEAVSRGVRSPRCAAGRRSFVRARASGGAVVPWRRPVLGDGSGAARPIRSILRLFD